MSRCDFHRSGDNAKHGTAHGSRLEGPVRRNIRTVGTIDYNETALREVTTKFKGWIEKLYVDSTGQQVHKGEPLFEIYSPDLYRAQNEYILASRSWTRRLKESALTKLKYLRYLRRADRGVGQKHGRRRRRSASAPQPMGSSSRKWWWKDRWSTRG